MLVNCIAYLNCQELGDIKVEEISNHIHPSDHFVWVDRYFQVVDVLEYELELIETVAKLHGGRVPAICVNTQEYFRDVYDHLYRINNALDSIRDTVDTATQVNLSMITIDQTNVNKNLQPRLLFLRWLPLSPVSRNEF